jgi:hypothetical protein
MSKTTNVAWGNHMPQPVEAVDAAERSRGFDPPLFVDIRIRRTEGDMTHA